MHILVKFLFHKSKKKVAMLRLRQATPKSFMPPVNLLTDEQLVEELIMLRTVLCH